MYLTSQIQKSRNNMMKYLLKPTKPQVLAAAIIESMSIAAGERDRMYSEFAQKSEERDENVEPRI